MVYGYTASVLEWDIKLVGGSLGFDSLCLNMW
jgi:hypothetical protein